MTAFLSRFCLLALLLLAGTALAPVAQAYTATGDLLKVLQPEVPGSTWDTVVTDATAESTPAAGNNGGTPIYHSTKLEESSFEGDFTADINMTSLAIFSDDGCDVTIDGVKVWAGKDQGQTLEVLSLSLHKLPITLNPGQTYHIKIDYSNIYYTGDGDIDGVTLFTWADPLAVTVDLTGVDSETLTAGVEGSGPIKAKVDNAPQSTATCTVTSVEWNWDFGDLQYSTDGETNWGVPPDGTAYNLTIDNYTIPETSFNMTLAPGYWSVILTATVTYHTTCGDISGSDWDYVGQTYTRALPDMSLPEIARARSLFHTASFDGGLLRRSHIYRQAKARRRMHLQPIGWQPAVGQWDGMDVDFNLIPYLPQLVQSHINFVGRYYGRNLKGKGINKKVLTYSEAVAISQNKISILGVFQMGGSTETGGLGWYTYNQGVLDGESAYLGAYSVRQPASATLYFGFDMGMTPSANSTDGINYPYANPVIYMKGVFAGISTAYFVTVQSDPKAPMYNTLGAYGCGLVCSTLKNQGWITSTWIAMATSWQQYDYVNPPSGFTGWDVHQFNIVGFDSKDVDPDIRHGNAGSFLVQGP